jgi:hypothetical protein
VASNSLKTGAIALHGPHHGAQKSTSAGLSDLSISASKLLSSTSNNPSPITKLLFFSVLAKKHIVSNSIGHPPDFVNLMSRLQAWSCGNDFPFLFPKSLTEKNPNVKHTDLQGR